MRRREFMAGLLFAATIGRAQAQQPAKLYRIAIVSGAVLVAEMSENQGMRQYSTLFKELRRLGYVEGQNLVVERYSGEGRTEHYAELAREVVRLKPDLILATPNAMVQHFKAATAAIPIVGIVGDPVAFGLVESLARPGGNITGISIDAGAEVWSKRLELLKEVVPRASRMGFLGSRYTWEGPTGVVLRDAAQRMGMSLIGPPLEGTIQEAEFRRVFEAMTQEHVDALIVTAESENLAYRRLILELAEKGRLPVIYAQREYVKIGGLMAYAYDLADSYRHAAGYIDQILKGTKAGEIPIYQMTKLELVINVKAAQVIGLTIPPFVLLRADEVIE